MDLCQWLTNSGNNTKAPQGNTCENKVTDADTFCSGKDDVTQSQKTNKRGPAAANNPPPHPHQSACMARCMRDLVP